ncbi:MAG: hypothetical protein KAR45_14195 [Desulfobacteraceae bacterium]|nr:hypothetical protein [Desulfobacteraceae bacterium]
MKTLKLLLIILCIVLGLSAFAFSKSKSRAESPQNTVKSNTVVPRLTKGAKVVPGVFRVKSVTFKTILLNGKKHLVTAIVFNKNIDASTVRENVNIRMLRKNEQHFWLDASTQNNIVHVRPNFITWVCGKPLEHGVYVMHLRGTIKSADGVFLDCNGDGKGEGGNLPAYESKLYLSPLHPPIDLEEKIKTERIEGLLDN